MHHPFGKYPIELLSGTNKEKLNYFQHGFVLRHSKMDEIFIKVIQEIEFKTEKQLINIVGPTGVGKTTLSKQLLAHMYQSYAVQSDPYCIPAILVEAPRLSRNVFEWRDFYRRILEMLEEPLSDNRVLIDGSDFPKRGRRYTSRSRTESQLRRDVEVRFQDYKVQYMIVDESHHILCGSANQNEANVDVLKSLANISKSRLIFLGTYQSLFSIEWSAQLIRRTLSIHFQHYDFSIDDERNIFFDSLNGLLAHVPYELDEEIIDFVDDLYFGSCGCIGILKQWIERAFKSCLENKSDKLKYENFRTTRLSNSDLRCIAEEIRAGKGYFKEPEESEVKRLLGMTEDKSKKPIQVKTSERRKPGVRKPNRDPLYS